MNYLLILLAVSMLVSGLGWIISSISSASVMDLAFLP